MNTTTLSQQTTLSQHGGIAGRRQAHYGHMQPMSLSCGSRTAACGQSAPLAVPQLAPVRLLRARLAAALWAQLGWHSQGEAGPLSAEPLPRVLELSASNTAHLPAFDHPGGLPSRRCSRRRGRRRSRRSSTTRSASSRCARSGTTRASGRCSASYSARRRKAARSMAPAVRHAGLEPQTSRQGPRQVCCSCASLDLDRPQVARGGDDQGRRDAALLRVQERLPRVRARPPRVRR